MCVAIKKLFNFGRQGRNQQYRNSRTIFQSNAKVSGNIFQIGLL